MYLDDDELMDRDRAKVGASLAVDTATVVVPKPYGAFLADPGR
jgi:hypothetical protein